MSKFIISRGFVQFFLNSSFLFRKATMRMIETHVDLCSKMSDFQDQFSYINPKKFLILSNFVFTAQKWGKFKKSQSIKKWTFRKYFFYHVMLYRVFTVACSTPCNRMLICGSILKHSTSKGFKRLQQSRQQLVAFLKDRHIEAKSNSYS